MKNFNNRKSIMEQGGLMIEALAMLGLIAVVTPTMYKKSAERTMEVEDINTSTTIRTLMNAAESYVAANYIQLLNDPALKLPEDQTQEQMAKKEITIVDDPTTDNVNENELAPYLPYKYETKGALYNYGTPKMTVVRSGDSISAFMLFPAKGSEAEGIGQERTVRIASLIGSNGGYVSEKGKQAHGVGGVWSLDDTHYSKIFPSDNSEKYSIVTASTNVSNSSTAGAEPDMTKYLQRTRENTADDGKELWRNAMRTDLYMGLVNNADDSWTPGNKTLYSIQNINKLIVGGHDTANKYNEDELKIADVDDSYGLYIKGSGSAGAGEGNAFINGSIEALSTGNTPATSLFKLRYDDLTKKDTTGHLTFDGTHFELGKTKMGSTETYAIQANTEGNVNTMNIYDTTVAIDAKDGSSRKIDILAADATTVKSLHIHEAKDAGTYGNKKALVSVNTSGDALPNGVNKLKAEDYATIPDFGVDIDGNEVVQGLLTAGQLDTPKVRASKLSVGSAKIDDADKWMDVDEKGVRIHDPASKYETSKQAKRQIIADDKAVAMRAGSAAKAVGENNDKLNGMDAELVLDDEGIVVKAGDGKNAVVASDEIGINIKDNVMKFGNTTDQGVRDTTKDQYLAEFGEGGNVDIKEGNLKVSNATNPVFVVRGNENITGIADGATGTDAASTYQIAGHGNTLFSDGTDTTRYLGMGFDDKSVAMNIIGRGDGQGGATSHSSTRVLVVDLDDRNYASYTDAPGESTAYNTKGKTDHQARELQEGSIYIRKGLIDVAPDKAQVDASANTGVAKNYNADEGRGVIRASRFVANNVTNDGKRVMVPDMFKGKFKNAAGGTSSKTVYEVFNGSEGANRYDTYMVNPAYTSVMNDIKLVSRSGARLSDILPDFITKAIYTATNTWTEDMFDGLGRDPSKYKLKCSGHSCDIDGRKDNVSGEASAKPASAVIGLVPVPQCPPGYQKVIQVTPASISMAQAGQLAESDYPGKAKNSSGHTVDVADMFNLKEGETIPSGVHANDSNTALTHLGKVKAAFDKVISQRPSQNEANPTYQRNFVIGGEKCKSWQTVNGTKICKEYESYDDVRTTLSPAVSGASTDNRYNTANKVDGVDVDYDDTYYIGTVKYEPSRTGKTKDIKLSDEALVGKVEKVSLRSTVVDDDLTNWYDGGSIRDTGTRYILTSTGDALEPMVFQKNTRMYTQAFPLSDGSDKDGVGAPYTRAWALMMGFIYPEATYSKLLSNTGQLMRMDENNLLWNVFPVQYTSLEAFVTTYCYWDSANRLGDIATDIYNTTGQLPQVENYYPDSYKPDDDGTLTFRKKLNDPSMKYDELW